MNIYLNKTVYEAAKERIAFVYDEFENVVVNFSGGKDSTCVLHLAIEVATEKNRLPVNVFFLDQEGEWENNIDYIREVMNMPEVNPLWFQIPFKIFNTASSTDHWLNAWGEGEEWLRPKEEIAYKENIYGKDRFTELLDAIPEAIFGRVACLVGMRTQETPKRKIAITEGNPTYKWVIWSSKRTENKRDFNPIYDWEVSDVWKYIHDNKFSYCKIYDYMFQYGVSLNNMRVSNVTHETAVESLYIMQEVEPDLYDKLTNRLGGISSASQMKDDMFVVKELPYMFKDWEEYRDHLLENLISEKDQEIFKKLFVRPAVKRYRSNKLLYEEFCAMCVKMILRNDIYLTSFQNFKSKITVSEWEYWKKHGKRKYPIVNKYIDYEYKRTNKS